MTIPATCPMCRASMVVEIVFHAFDYAAMDREAQRKAAAHDPVCAGKWAEREVSA